MQAEIFNNSCDNHFKLKYGTGFSSIFKNIHMIAKNEGYSALYKGMSASTFGTIHPIVFFPLYEKLKIFFKDNFEHDK